MKNILFFTGIVIISFSNLTCKPPKIDYPSVLEEAEWKQDPNFDKPLCIVLCDFTESMDKEISKENVCKAAQKILNDNFGKFLIRFYTVSNTMEEPFFETGMPTIEKINNKKKLEAAINHSQPYFSDSLHTLLANKKKDSLEKSYIIYSIERALRTFHSFNPTGENKDQLYVLSDMLESGTSSFGKLNLEDGSYKEDSVIVAGYSRKEPPFTSLRNLSITTVLYSNQVKNILALENFWKEVFKKLGYLKEIYFSSDVVTSR